MRVIYYDYDYNSIDYAAMIKCSSRLLLLLLHIRGRCKPVEREREEGRGSNIMHFACKFGRSVREY